MVCEGRRLEVVEAVVRGDVTGDSGRRHQCDPMAGQQSRSPPRMDSLDNEI